MKAKFATLFLIAVFSSVSAQASTVTLNATAGQAPQATTGLQDQLGNPLAAGELGLLLVDSGNNGIGPIKAGSFTIGTFYNGTDDYIAGKVASTIVPFGTVSVVQFSSLNVSNPSLSQGMQYDILWFSSIPSSATSFTVGAPYGVTRDATWVLPPDGGTNSFLPAANGGPAIFTVTSVPEPSTFAYIGLAGLPLLSRRFRRTILAQKS